MKIVNHTVWRTDHLRAIFQRAAEQELEPAHRKLVRVKVIYTRGGWSSGCAWIGGRNAIIRLRHPRTRAWGFGKFVHVSDDDPRQGCGRWHHPDGTSGKVVREQPKGMTADQQRELVLRVASVAVHEFAHLRGMHHDKMPKYYRWSGKWREYVAWAADMPLEEKPVKAKPKATAPDKLAHVQRMKRHAETRLKRAQTLLKKWQARERYYQKQMAAQRPE